MGSWLLWTLTVWLVLVDLQVQWLIQMDRAGGGRQQLPWEQAVWVLCKGWLFLPTLTPVCGESLPTTYLNPKWYFVSQLLSDILGQSLTVWQAGREVP